MAEHELTHTPFAPWCVPCIMGRGVAAPHSTQALTSAEKELPVVQLDFHFMKEDGNQCEEANAYATTVGGVDVDTMVPLQLSVPIKDSSSPYVVACVCIPEEARAHGSSI